MAAAKAPVKDPAASRRGAARNVLRIVALGGGTSLSVLLQGLKLHTLRRHGKAPLVDLSAIVTVSDDGGSSGRLRRAFDIPRARGHPQLHGGARSG